MKVNKEVVLKFLGIVFKIGGELLNEYEKSKEKNNEKPGISENVES